MTAEVAIMNLHAVALAADSAVTSYPGGNQKIFSSANKLFALSEVAPVGVLVYGKANFMSIPWETVVKEYRWFLGGKTFPKLHEYATDFCGFLSEVMGVHLGDENQIRYAQTLADFIFREIKSEIGGRIKDTLTDIVKDGNNDIDGLSKNIERKNNEITKEVVEHYYIKAKQSNILEDVPEDFQSTLNAEMNQYLKTSRASIFGRHLPRGVPRKLNYIALKAIGGFFDDITAHPPSGLMSGVVISGFGDQDIFPALVALRIEGMVRGLLKLSPNREQEVLSQEKSSAIYTFAQTDMVYQFMEGMASVYIPYMRDAMQSHLSEYSSILLNIINEETGIDISHLRNRVMRYFPKIADSFVEEVKNMGAKYFSDPIINVVAMLPKEQLAEMAESLVSLTALKRRVSSQEETVGGPIDVAVITKGDGLIWIKRKHYFDAELNPSYFARTSHRRTQYAQAAARFNRNGNARSETPIE